MNYIKIDNSTLRINLLKKSYFIFKSTLFIQMQLQIIHDSKHYLFQLDTFLNSPELTNKNVQIRLVKPLRHSMISLKKQQETEMLLKSYGPFNIFKMFKEDVFSMLENELDKNPAMINYRFLLLPL